MLLRTWSGSLIDTRDYKRPAYIASRWLLGWVRYSWWLFVALVVAAKYRVIVAPAGYYERIRNALTHKPRK